MKDEVFVIVLTLDINIEIQRYVKYIKLSKHKKGIIEMFISYIRLLSRSKVKCWCEDRTGLFLTNDEMTEQDGVLVSMY